MKESILALYDVLDEHEVKDIHSNGTLLKHKKSGARVLLLSNDDENKVFYVGFRTPVENSTGVPHIIEHSVLCGSEKFPAKDPFVELVKGSLNTFLNAMTYPDKTVYPVASCNDKDFQNLMDVYMDAVFHPNIYKKQEIFKQEGWHYELEDVDSDLQINGVVYNEMKGAFSSPEGVLERLILNSLHPDTTYGNESGGDPEDIPNLTYEDYLDFHRRYYHPCNSYIYLYGDMDMEEKLLWLDAEYLSKYEKIELDSRIQKQEAFEKPVELHHTYNITSTESEQENTYLAENFSIGTVLDEKLYLAFDILDYALLSMPGAPLREALLKRGIGKDIMGGYDGGTYQPIFSIIAKNTDLEKKEEFLQVIRETLEEQVKNGVDKKAILAGINASEFRFREADFGSYPKGLIYGLNTLTSWIYDENRPYVFLEMLDTYKFLREQVETDYFEKLIETYFLNNKHVSVVVVEPEKNLNEKKEEKLAKKLAEYKSTLSKEEIEALVADTKNLKKYQEEPSTIEELEKIPVLERKDIRKSVLPFQNELREIQGSKALFHDIFTNGILYLQMVFDVSHLEEEDFPYLAFMNAVLGYMDTSKHTYGEIANEVNFYTGGIGGSFNIYTPVEDLTNARATYELRVKSLYDNCVHGVRILNEILFDTDLSDDNRLHDILLELKSKLQMSLPAAGHQTAVLRASSYFSKASRMKDLTSGIAFYEVLDDIESNFEEKKDFLRQRIREVREKVLDKANLLINITADEDGFAVTAKELPVLLEKIKETTPYEGKVKVVCRKKNEGFMDASQVQYVARTGNFREGGYTYTGALKILEKALNYDYLWNNIRVMGGAYGCMSGFARNGNSYFASYRDPNLKATNEVFDGIVDYIENFHPSERDMTKFVIGTISDLDTPLNPNAKGIRSLVAYQTGITEEMIQKERDEILGATEESVRSLKGLVAEVLSQNYLCAIGNEGVLKKEDSMFDEKKPLFN